MSPFQHKSTNAKGLGSAPTLGTYSATSTSGLKVKRGVRVFFPWELDAECGSAGFGPTAGDRCCT